MHYVRIIIGKIAEFDTGSEQCNILIDDSILGTHFDSCIYMDGKFEPNPDWVQRVEKILVQDFGGLNENSR